MINLRCRTGYSFRAAVGKIEETADRLKETGATVAAITDRASTFGFVKWTKLVKSLDMRPIYGVELAVTPDESAKKPVLDYWTFLAIDDLKWINRLVHTATGQFRYEPLLTYDQANRAEGVIKIIGRRSLLARVVPDERTYLAWGPGLAPVYAKSALAMGLRPIAASDNYYPRPGDRGLWQVICGDHGSDPKTWPQHILSQEEWLAQVAQYENAPAERATGAFHVGERNEIPGDDLSAPDISWAPAKGQADANAMIGADARYENGAPGQTGAPASQGPDRLCTHQNGSISGDGDARGLAPASCNAGAATQQACNPGPYASAAAEAARRIAELCRAAIPKSTLLKPKRPASLREMCERGAAELGIDLTNPIYSARLIRELDLIESKAFADYFYIVADVVAWARKKMCVGPARGSSCGSLVCYLLRITNVDPIPYNLIFERFIDINRNDLPDIDIDFSMTKRDIVFRYLEETYGRERVARLGTVMFYQSASAFREMCGALNIPPWEADKITDVMIKRGIGDVRGDFEILDTFHETEIGAKFLEKFPEAIIGTRIEGHPRHASQHAAGVVLTDREISDFVAIDAKTGAVQCDKIDAEILDLLKIDALGLKQLSIFEMALELIGKPHDFLDSIPLDDERAFAVMNERRYAGIFQFNGNAARNLARQIKIENIEDIVALNALARPGPLNSGSAVRWIKRKRGDEPVTYAHPLFEKHVAVTFGEVIYQEQIMSILREIGGLDWGEITNVRKAMAKSKGVEAFRSEGEKFKAGAIARGISEAVVEQSWAEMCAFGQYGFNRSHAVAYSIITYQCCWLKAHHPNEFAAATLQFEKDDDRQLAILRELDLEGISFVPVSEESTDRWSVGEIDGRKRLLGPLSNVKGIGPKLLAEIMECRLMGRPLPNRAKKLLATPVTPLDQLWPIAAGFQRHMPNPAAKNIHTPATPIMHVLDRANRGDTVVMFGIFKRASQVNENRPEKVAERGYEISSIRADRAVHAFVGTFSDDTGDVFVKIHRDKHEQFGLPIIERGRFEHSLYVMKGKVFKIEDFTGIYVEAVRYIGDMEAAPEPEKAPEIEVQAA